MYICKEIEKLEKCRCKLRNINKNEYPKEEEIPLIYVENKNSRNTVDLRANYGMPYYDEIDINLVTETNTSCSRQVIYSNYERVLMSINYIKKNECRPISILKDDNNYYIENGKHRYLAHILLGKDKMPVSIRERVKDREDNFKFIQYKRALFSDDGVNVK
jgi:hypothetical protein